MDRERVSTGTEWERQVGYSRAIRAEVFGDVRPAATMVEVSGLAADGAVVEVEAEAVLGE